MPTILTNGIQLPDKGSVDWYSSMQSNYNLIDTHLGNTDIHVTAEDKANWDSKQGSLSQAQLDAIAQVATNTNDIATLQSDKADASHTHSSSDITDIGDYATKDYVDNSISGLVDNAPDALNTLNELSAALNDDSNFASTVTTALAAKANSADLATVATSGSYTDLTDKPSIPSKISDLIDDSNIPWQTIPNVYSRNEPVVTDILWSGNLNHGDITLSAPFTDYDVLMCVFGSSDNSPPSTPWDYSFIPVWILRKAIIEHDLFGVVPTTINITNDRFNRWIITIADSTTTFFKHHYDNGLHMWRIIGIRLTSAAI